MKWVKINKSIFDEDEIIAIAEKRIGMFNGYILIFRGGNTLDIEITSSDKTADQLWQRFVEKTQTPDSSYETGVTV